VIYFFDGGASAPSSSTWNPSDKGANVVLSNGDLSATYSGSGNYQSVRGTRGNTAGKRYFEYTATFVNGASARMMGGVADSGLVLANIHLGQNSVSAKKSAGYYSPNGRFYRNLTNAATDAAGTSYITGDVIGVEVDFSTFTLSFYASATGTLRHSYTDATPWGTLYPAVCLISSAICTLNATGPFVYTPSGVVAWDDP
jgi:hypothetical protein